MFDVHLLSPWFSVFLILRRVFLIALMRLGCGRFGASVAMIYWTLRARFHFRSVRKGNKNKVQNYGLVVIQLVRLFLTNTGSKSVKYLVKIDDDTYNVQEVKKKRIDRCKRTSFPFVICMENQTDIFGSHILSIDLSKARIVAACWPWKIYYSNMQ